VQLVAVLDVEALMTDHGDELREAAEGKPSGLDRARSFVWRHRTFFAPLVGILAAKLCPLLGWAAGPCAIVGDALRGSLTP
jgi:hypothetical protein